MGGELLEVWRTACTPGAVWLVPPHWNCLKIIEVLAVDCVVAATGSKLFAGQIVADIGRSYGVSHSTISRL